MAGDWPKEWSRWLSLAEWWYNTSYHTSIKTTPYEVVYGQKPPLHVPYLARDSSFEVVDRTLSAREAAVRVIKDNLAKKLRIGCDNWLTREDLRENFRSGTAPM